MAVDRREVALTVTSVLHFDPDVKIQEIRAHTAENECLLVACPDANNYGYKWQG